MSSKRNRDKWLLLQMTDGSNIVSNINSVISPISDTTVGTVVIVDRGTGSHEAATVVGFSNDRQILERQITPKAEAAEEPEQEDKDQENEEPEDFSASGSSWAPSDHNVSSDEEVEPKLKVPAQRFYSKNRRGRVIKPCHRAEAVNTNSAKKRKMNESTERKFTHSIADKKSLPDSTRKNNSPAPNKNSDIVSVNVLNILDMKKCFYELFSILKEFKPTAYDPENDSQNNFNVINKTPAVKYEVNNTLNDNVENASYVSDRSRSEDLNRSDDNVLITNKYDSKNNNNKMFSEKGNNKNDDLNEWIPIGSGKTLIHKDKYRKVKWKSYTVATRSLLLAVFPRRILATHSLTGKRSPAFQDKPAKMCLDPKIVTDVIIEITDRFNVKESLVRSIITTKCADECKMFKMRQRRKTQPALNNTKNDDYDDANITC